MRCETQAEPATLEAAVEAAQKLQRRRAKRLRYSKKQEAARRHKAFQSALKNAAHVALFAALNRMRQHFQEHRTTSNTLAISARKPFIFVSKGQSPFITPDWLLPKKLQIWEPKPWRGCFYQVDRT
jgi:hypothetical protein